MAVEQDTVCGKFVKAPDLEIHTKVTVIDGETFLNIREYVLSTKQYGRGLTVPMEQAVLLEAAIAAAMYTAKVEVQ